MPLTGRSTGVESSSAQPSRPDIPGVISTSSWPQSELAAGGFFLRERHLLHAINTAKKTAKLKIARFLRNKACGKCCRKMCLVLQRPSALSYFGLECSLTAKWKHPQNQLTVFLSWGFSAVQTCSQRFVNHGHRAIGVYSGGRLWGGPLMIHPQSSPPADRVA